jgi:hypothetical protein
MEKLWPSLAHMNYAKKISTQNLIGNIIKKIHKQLIKKKLIENTNEISICAAAALWRPLDQSEIEIRNQKREERNQANIQSYTNLMEMLNSLFKDSTMQVFLCLTNFSFYSEYSGRGDNKTRLSHYCIFYLKNICRFHRRAFEHFSIVLSMKILNYDGFV